MKVLGRRSLSSFFKLLLDIAFYGLGLGGAILIVVATFAVRGRTEQIKLSLPVHIAIMPPAYHIRGASGEAVNATLDDTSGNLTINHPPVVAVMLTAAGVILGEMVLLLVLYRLRRIFRRFVEGRPFLDENARDLRFICIAVISGELVWTVFRYLAEGAVARTLSSEEISFLAVFAPNLPIIASGLALLILAEIFREGIQMRADLETARDIQTSLVAPEASHHGAMSIHARMRAAAEVGGDYYDVIDLGGGRLAFVVADVAGKGLPAALLMTLLRGSLRALISAGLRGSALVTALNTHLMANTPDNRMVTFFYGELDPATGALTYINAGHNPAYLYDAVQRQTLASNAIVLGMFDGMPFPEASVTLRSGARLLLYTDGVTEAENGDGDQFGVERLDAAISDRGQTEPNAFVDAVMASVERFRGNARQSDDITIMLISREEMAAGV